MRQRLVWVRIWECVPVHFFNSSLQGEGPLRRSSGGERSANLWSRCDCEYGAEDAGAWRCGRYLYLDWARSFPARLDPVFSGIGQWMDGWILVCGQKHGDCSVKTLDVLWLMSRLASKKKVAFISQGPSDWGKGECKLYRLYTPWFIYHHVGTPQTLHYRIESNHSLTP